jgi:hypothetical protein
MKTLVDFALTPDLVQVGIGFEPYSQLFGGQSSRSHASSSIHALMIYPTGMFDRAWIVTIAHCFLYANSFCRML